eukprot:12918233-Prorocentrum_lima.AAC.1
MELRCVKVDGGTCNNRLESRPFLLLGEDKVLGLLVITLPLPVQIWTEVRREVFFSLYVRKAAVKTRSVSIV